MVQVKRTKHVPDNTDFIRSRNNVEKNRLAKEIERIDKTKRQHLSRMNADQQHRSSLAFGDDDEEADAHKSSSFRMFRTHFPGFCYHRDGRPRMKGDALLYLYKGTKVTSYHVLRALLFTNGLLDIDKLLTMQAVTVQTLHPELLSLRPRKSKVVPKSEEHGDISSDSGKEEETKVDCAENVFEMLHKAGFPSRENLESSNEDIIRAMDNVFGMLQTTPKETLAQILSMCSRKFFQTKKKQQLIQSMRYGVPAHIASDRRLTLTLKRDSKPVDTVKEDSRHSSKNPALLPTEYKTQRSVSFMPQIRASTDMSPVVENVLKQIQQDADKLGKGKMNKFKSNIKLMTVLLGLSKSTKENVHAESSVNAEPEEKVIYESKKMELDASKLNLQLSTPPKKTQNKETKVVKKKDARKVKALPAALQSNEKKRASVPFVVRQQKMVEAARNRQTFNDGDESSGEDESPPESISESPSDEFNVEGKRESQTSTGTKSEPTKTVSSRKNSTASQTPLVGKTLKSSANSVKPKISRRSPHRDNLSKPDPSPTFAKPSFRMSALRNIKLTQIDILKVRQEVIAQILSRKLTHFLEHPNP